MCHLSIDSCMRNPCWLLYRLLSLVCFVFWSFSVLGLIILVSSLLTYFRLPGIPSFPPRVSISAYLERSGYFPIFRSFFPFNFLFLLALFISIFRWLVYVMFVVSSTLTCKCISRIILTAFAMYCLRLVVCAHGESLCLSGVKNQHQDWRC